MKHTKGPWTYSLQTGTSNNPIIHCGTEPNGLSSMNLEAIMYRNDLKMMANFNLIIAAPEMLEALELVLNDNRLMNAMSKEQAKAIMYSVSKAKSE